MKKLEVKSLFYKRLIPLLLVPTLLGSNFASVKSFADESEIESTAEQSAEESTQNPEETTENDGEQSGDQQDEQAGKQSQDEASAGSSDDAAGSTGSSDAASEGSSGDAAGDASSDDAAGKASSDDAAGKASSDDAAGKASSDDAAGSASSDDAAGNASSDDAAGSSSSDDAAGNASSDDAAGSASSDEEPEEKDHFVPVTVEISVDGKKADDKRISVTAETKDGSKKISDGSYDVKVDYDETKEYSNVWFSLNADTQAYFVEGVTFNGEYAEYTKDSHAIKASIKSDEIERYEEKNNTLSISLKKIDKEGPKFDSNIRSFDNIVSGTVQKKYETCGYKFYLGSSFKVTVRLEEPKESDDDTENKTENNTEVYFVVNGEHILIEKNNDTGDYSWKAECAGNYEITSIYARNKDGKTTELRLFENAKLFLAIPENSCDQAKIEGEYHPEKAGWYSKTQAPEMKYTVSATSSRYITTLNIAGKDYYPVNCLCFDICRMKFYFTCSQDVSFKPEELTNGKDQIIPVKATFFYCGEFDENRDTQTTELKYNADNEDPKADLIEADLYTADDYLGFIPNWKLMGSLSEVDNYVFHNGSYKVEVKIPVSCDEFSGFERAECKFNRANDFEPVLAEKKGDYYYFTKTFEIEDGCERVFNISEIRIYDLAGNYAGTTKFRNKCLVLDKNDPTIDVSVEKKKQQEEIVQPGENGAATGNSMNLKSVNVPKGESGADYEDEVEGNKRYFFKYQVNADVNTADYDLGDNKADISLKVFKGSTNTEIATEKEGGWKFYEEAERKHYTEAGLNACGYEDTIQNYKRTTKSSYGHIYSGDGRYEIESTTFDKAGNGSNEKTTVVVDTTDPVAELKFYNGNTELSTQTTEKSKFYSSNITVEAIFTDDWIDFNNTALLVKGEYHKKDGTRESFEQTIGMVGLDSENSPWEKVSDDKYRIKYTTECDGDYHFSVVAKDLVGRTPKKCPEGGFTVDTTKPEANFILENKDVRNGKYYNDVQVAVLTVKDFNFDPNNITLTVNAKYGSPVKGKWTHDGGDYTHTMRIEFPNDGIYSLEFSCTDKAGNTGTAKPVDEFVVDMTEPKLTVTYTGGAPKNEIYYKNSRYADVQIEDLSFSKDLVEYRSQELGEDGVLAPLGTFASSELKNTAKIFFDRDGKYGYVINCTDLAGNTCKSYISDVFVIDTKVPEVKFSGVANFSANNGVVAPVLTYTDKYMDMKETTVTMVGSNNGPVSLASTQAQIKDGYTVSYEDFAHNKKMDDLYTLEATVVDLAGNETKEELVFSVNRFGSVFVLGNDAKELNEKYYTKEATDVTITEINVDDLTYRDVSISRDGDIKELKKNKGYKVAKQGSDTTWKTFTYTVSKDNFKKDGVYSVTVYTKDRATNVQDNKSRDAEVNFAKDGTKPSIVTSGLKSGEKYKEATHSFNIDVKDNMGVSSLVVYKNDEEIKSFTDEELQKDGGVESITLDESDKAVNISLVAEDYAGNVETVKYDNIVVSSKDDLPEALGEVLDEDGNVVENVVEEKGADTTKNGLIFVWIVVALGAVAIAAGTGVVLYKKRETK